MQFCSISSCICAGGVRIYSLYILEGPNYNIPLEDSHPVLQSTQAEVVPDVIRLVGLHLVVAVGQGLDFGASETRIALQVERGLPVGRVVLRLDECGVTSLSVDDLAAKVEALELDIAQNTGVLATGVVDDELGRCQESSRKHEDH